MRWLWGLILLALIAGGWSLWHYQEFRRCGERFCSPARDAPVFRLPEGVEVRVLGSREDGRRLLEIDYLSGHDRGDLTALCREARAVWESVLEERGSRRPESAVLGPTSPKSEFLGMRFLVVPLYTCCVSTYLRVERSPSGAWTFPDCP